MVINLKPVAVQVQIRVQASFSLIRSFSLHISITYHQYHYRKSSSGLSMSPEVPPSSTARNLTLPTPSQFNLSSPLLAKLACLSSQSLSLYVSLSLTSGLLDLDKHRLSKLSQLAKSLTICGVIHGMQNSSALEGRFINNN